MATPPEDVRLGLEAVTAAAVAEVSASLSQAATPAEVLEAAADTLGLILPPFHDAAGMLAVDWYGELRDEVNSLPPYTPDLLSDVNVDWVLRETRDQAARHVEQLPDLDAAAQAILDDALAFAQKEAARGFRDTTRNNAATDPGAIGWSRHTREDGCKFCRMLARNSAVYRSEAGARFGAHPNCNCVARVEFEGGGHGPDADVFQYLASKRVRTPAEKAALREYLNRKYPDAPG